MAAFRLLLIDSCEKFLSDAGISLRGAGYLVETARDRDDAIEQVAENSFDLILLADELAPAVAAIRAWDRSRGRKPAVVVGLMADGFPTTNAVAAAAGMDGCDLKPTSRSGILRLAARWTMPSDGSLGPGLDGLKPAYLSARRADAQRMRARLSERGLADIAAIAHRLRGTGGTYGFPRLTELGAELESAAIASDATRIAIALDRLDEVLMALPSLDSSAPGTAA